MKNEFQFRLLYERGEDDFSFQAGYFENDLLNGPGRETIVSPDEKGYMKKSITRRGFFKDGKLHGLGFINELGKDLVFGFFENGELVPLEEWKRRFTPVQHYYRDARETNPTQYYGEMLDGRFVGKGVFLCNEVSRDLAYYFQTPSNGEKGPSFFVRKFNSVISENWFDIEEGIEEQLDDITYNFRAERKKVIHIKEGTEMIQKGFYSSSESLELYIPRSVKRIEHSSIGSARRYRDINVDVFYSGTKEEWEAIDRGDYEMRTEEDWYGYYYHNSERYSTYRAYLCWFYGVKNDKVTIHCLDQTFQEGKYR